MESCESAGVWCEKGRKEMWCSAVCAGSIGGGGGGGHRGMGINGVVQHPGGVRCGGGGNCGGGEVCGGGVGNV